MKPRYEWHPKLNPYHSLNKGLIAWWLFNEGVGQSVRSLPDVTRSTFGATSGNPPHWEHHADGFTLGNYGSDAGYIDITGLSTPTKDFTVATRFLLNNNRVSSAWDGFISTNTTYFYLQTKWDGSNCYLQIYDGTSEQYVTPALEFGRIHTATFVVTRGISNSTAEIFDNGRKLGSLTVNNISQPFTRLLNSYTDDTCQQPVFFIKYWERKLSNAEVLEDAIHPYGTLNTPRLLIEPRSYLYVPSLVGVPDAPTGLNAEAA